jgi:hypothetical protein
MLWGTQKLRNQVASLSEKLHAEQRRSYRYVQRVAELEIRLLAAEVTLAKVRTALADVPLAEVQP